jgi:hypothetical protein
VPDSPARKGEKGRASICAHRNETFGVVDGLVDALAPDPVLSPSEGEQEQSGAEGDGEPVCAHAETSDVFAELELGDGSLGLCVPDDDLVGREKRCRRTADEEEDVGAVQRDDKPERALGDVCWSRNELERADGACSQGTEYRPLLMRFSRCSAPQTAQPPVSAVAKTSPSALTVTLSTGEGTGAWRAWVGRFIAATS